jgi:hypothetical protein
MWRLIQFLILGHVHQWETLSRSPLTMGDDKKPVARGDRYILRCKTCGEVKKRDLI